MPRKPRLFVPGAIYHVYCRTARGELVFVDDTEAEEFIEVVKEVRDLDEMTILGWCLMGNHYHLILRTGEVPLWRSMARLQGRTAKGFNRRHRYLGRLWQSRYKARVVDTERYFTQVISYVHLNPVAAGIVEDPVDHRWSGHRALIGRGPALLTDVVESLRGFGRTTFTARRNYLSCIRSVAEARWLSAGLLKLPWWTDAEDAEEVADGRKHSGALKFDGAPLDREYPRVEVEELVGLFCQWQGMETQELCGTGRSGDAVEGRIMLTGISALFFKHRLRDLACVLRKNPGTVSRWLSIAQQRMRDELRYRRHIKEGADTLAMLYRSSRDEAQESTM